MLFLDKLTQICKTFPDKPALEQLSKQKTDVITFAQLESRVYQSAAYLQALGISQGDRVALHLPKSLAFIYLHLAAMRLGAISLPLNPAFTATELEYFLSDSGARVLFSESSKEAELKAALTNVASLETACFVDEESFLALLPNKKPNLPDLYPESTALMIYTSGTTGRPKGAELSHKNLTTGINALHDAWAWQESDTLLHVLPIFHTHGLMVALHGALNAGASSVLVDKFDAQQSLDLLASKRFSVFMAVPTIHTKLLEKIAPHKLDLSHMRLITSGSAGLADDVFKAFQNTFAYTLLERFGMSETGMNLSNPYAGERRIGSVGLPLPGVEARIVNPATDEPLADGNIGEVQIKGDHVFKGYWQQPQKTAEAFTKDGWLRTGDLGFRSSDGYYSLKGRSKDLIISGGFNVYPPELELVLAQHSGIAASAVIGCPDKTWGERVIAIVELKANTRANSNEILGFCKKRLAPYKTPKEVHIVNELPRNAMGKVQKEKLRKAYCS
jgi:malonyl-CoA/methylmalonyl-CoA synthetase